MKTIKYIVDRGFRKAGEVRTEETGVADNLILRGFAEETDDAPDAGTGEAQAVAQYNPEGSEPDPDSRGGAGTLAPELNAPGEVGGNTRAQKTRASTSGKTAGAILTANVSVGEKASADEVEAAAGTNGAETSDPQTSATEKNEQSTEQSS